MTHCFVCKIGTLEEMELEGSDKVLGEKKNQFGDLIVRQCILVYSAKSN